MVTNLVNPTSVAAAMVEAIRFGDLVQVQRILAAGFDVNYSGSQHNSILHTAIISKSVLDEVDNPSKNVLIVWRYLLAQTSFKKMRKIKMAIQSYIY